MTGCSAKKFLQNNFDEASFSDKRPALSVTSSRRFCFSGETFVLKRKMFVYFEIERMSKERILQASIFKIAPIEDKVNHPAGVFLGYCMKLHCAVNEVGKNLQTN